jgi:ribokinase
VKNLLETQGEKGALRINQVGKTQIQAFPIEAIDTTAAGVCFVGAFAAALAEGKPSSKAASWACAASTISFTRIGARHHYRPAQK